MGLAGRIQTIIGDGIIKAVGPEGQRTIKGGDEVFVGETLMTEGQVSFVLVDEQGRELASVGANSVLLVDETVVGEVPAEDAAVRDAQAMQQALVEGESPGEDPTATGEELPEDPTAAGTEDPFQGDNPEFYEGDQTAGAVDPRGLGIDPSTSPEDVVLAQSSFIDPELPITEPEPPPEPLFIVGSDPEDDPYDSDIDGSDTPFTIAPEGIDPYGAISGGDAGDILVGDAGGIDTYDVEYTLAVDMSRSNVINGYDATNAQNINIDTETAEFILSMYQQVEAIEDGTVRINLLTFSGEANTLGWIQFDKTQGLDGMTTTSNIGALSDQSLADLSAGNVDGLVSELNAIYLSSLGWHTNYEAALAAANDIVSTSDFDVNRVVFISDGSPNADNYKAELGELNDSLGTSGSIRAVGSYKGTDDDSKSVLDEIDSTGESIQIDEIDQLSSDLADLSGYPVLSPAGNDNISGNDGDDLIFGDVLNTDGVYEDLSSSEGDNPDLDLSGLDLSGIEDLPDGSGWEVFETLEETNDNWTRDDTIQYIEENHETLGLESGRGGGDDLINGGGGDDIIYGQEGSDTIDGGEGIDTILGGGGDDVISIGDGTGSIDGGDGIDTLMVTDMTLDFSNVTGDISNMEKISLEADSAQNISLTLDEVMDMTSTDNMLSISGGNDGDTVILEGDGTWTQSGDDTFANADSGVIVNVSDVSVTVYDTDGTAVTTSH